MGFFELLSIASLLVAIIAVITDRGDDPAFKAISSATEVACY